MSEDKKKITITFAPGAFDNFDGTQEELDELIAEVQRLAESGELEEMSIPLDSDDMDSISDEDRQLIDEALSRLENSQKRSLQ